MPVPRDDTQSLESRLRPVSSWAEAGCPVSHVTVSRRCHSRTGRDPGSLTSRLILMGLFGMRNNEPQNKGNLVQDHVRICLLETFQKNILASEIKTTTVASCIHILSTKNHRNKSLLDSSSAWS